MLFPHRLRLVRTAFQGNGEPLLVAELSVGHAASFFGDDLVRGDLLVLAGAHLGLSHALRGDAALEDRRVLRGELQLDDGLATALFTYLGRHALR